MSLSSYHKKYADQNDEEIQKRVKAKARELADIFRTVSLKTDSDPVRLAILGCGDKRFIPHHERIFGQTLKREVEATIFDITVDHLRGEPNVFRHDCTLPLPNPPYDITYGHVLLKFIETEKQFDLLKNSFNALRPGGMAIHVFDRKETETKDSKLPDGSWTVPLERWKEKLTSLGIKYNETPVKYGLALVLLRQ